MIVPFSVLLMIASEEESTIAASWRRCHAERVVCPVRSKTTPTWLSPSGKASKQKVPAGIAPPPA